MPRTSQPTVGSSTWIAAVIVGFAATFGTAYVMLVLAFWSDAGDHAQTPYLLAAQVASELIAVALVIGALTSRGSHWLRSGLSMVAAIVIALAVPLVVLPLVTR